jgi:hypothetical protein
VRVQSGELRVQLQKARPEQNIAPAVLIKVKFYAAAEAVRAGSGAPFN